MSRKVRITLLLITVVSCFGGSSARFVDWFAGDRKRVDGVVCTDLGGFNRMLREKILEM